MSSIQIRPNRSAAGLVAVLVAMIYAGLSQNNAAAFLLAFLLISLGAVSALHAWANLRGIVVAAEPISSVFQGEPLVVPLLMRAEVGRLPSGLWIGSPGATPHVDLGELLEGVPKRAELLLPTPTRGRFDQVEVEISSKYPLGFFTARRLFTIKGRFFIYPRAEGDIPLPVDEASPKESLQPSRPEGDDFAGVRDWRAGESMRHVDWKAVARGQRVMVKQWAGGVSRHFFFADEQMSELATEARLRQLARWVVLAERMGASYELRVGSARVGLGQGEPHFQKCLRRLAEAPGDPTEKQP